MNRETANSRHGRGGEGDHGRGGEGTTSHPEDLEEDEGGGAREGEEDERVGEGNTISFSEISFSEISFSEISFSKSASRNKISFSEISFSPRVGWCVLSAF